GRQHRAARPRQRRTSLEEKVHVPPRPPEATRPTGRLRTAVLGIALALTALLGCATAYQPSGFTGGFEDRTLGPEFLPRPLLGGRIHVEGPGVRLHPAAVRRDHPRERASVLRHKQPASSVPDRGLPLDLQLPTPRA